MAVLGIVAKLRVPYAHTSLEIIKMRYGKYAHCESSPGHVPGSPQYRVFPVISINVLKTDIRTGLFILLNLVNNIFGCGSMILAGSQLVTGMTGMHVVAAAILIPAGGKPIRAQWPTEADLSTFKSSPIRPLVVSKQP